MDLAGTGVPVIDITGAADGPQLTVISGVHGCEYASMAGVRRWAAALDPAAAARPGAGGAGAEHHRRSGRGRRSWCPRTART